jgi:hypothetical protein
MTGKNRWFIVFQNKYTINNEKLAPQFMEFDLPNSAFNSGEDIRRMAEALAADWNVMLSDIAIMFNFQVIR